MAKATHRHAPRKTRGSELLLKALQSGKRQDDIAKSMSKLIGRPVNQSSLSKWANHRHMPQGEAMVAMQTLLGIPVESWTQPPESADDDDGPQGITQTGTDG